MTATSSAAGRRRHSQLAAQLGSGQRDQLVQVGLAAATGHGGNDLAGLRVLYPEVNPNVRAISQVEVRTQNDKIAAQIFSHAGERVRCQGVGFRQREIVLYPSHVFSGDGEQLLAGRQFAGEHFRERSREPSRLGTPRKILEPKDGDATPRGGGWNQPDLDARGVVAKKVSGAECKHDQRSCSPKEQPRMEGSRRSA